MYNMQPKASAARSSRSTPFAALQLLLLCAFAAAADTSCCATALSLQERILALLETEQWQLGECDAVMLLPLLQRRFRDSVKRQPAQWLIDIGANAGATSALMMELYTTAPCARTTAARAPNGDLSCNYLAHVSVLAVEAVPPTLQRLEDRARREGWYNHSFFLAAAAISDHDADNVSIHSIPGHAADEQASLTAAVATLLFTHTGEPVASATEVHYVRQASMDSLARQVIPPDASIFILKSDVEGLDPAVLLGSQGLLDAKRVQWVLFEYGKKWSITNGTNAMYTLKGAVAWMRSRGYWCFLVTPTHMLPLYDAWWFSPKLEFRQWSNVVCTHMWPAALVTFYNAGGIYGLHEAQPPWVADGCC